MAKQLLLNVLVRVLGEFIELDENNFSLGVWSGTVVLTNLKLKADNILQKFNFVIYHGYVERLEIVIPWASLLTNPLKIRIEGVILDVGPVDLDGLNKEDILQMMIQEKLQKLKLIDQFLDISSGIVLSSELQAQKSSSASTTSESYVQQWSSRIIDNIELSFSKIHVRYEDSLSISGRTVAAGVTLDSFVLATCDEEWRVGFQSKQSSPGKEIVYKMATIDGLGIYWQIDSSPVSTLPFEEWKATMLQLIYGNSHREQSLSYILSPRGSSMSMKLTHFKRAAAGEVRFAVSLDNNDLRLNLDSQQFKQLFTIYSNIAALQEVRDPKNLRPPQRPLDGRKAVRAWWKYGVRLINMRNKYLKTLKLIKKAQAEKLPPDAFLPSKIYHEFQEMEERLPLKVLEAFRKRAAAEFVEEQKLEKAKSGKRDGGQWWGLLGGQTSGINDIVKTGGEDISMEGILSELDRLESSNARQAFQAFSLSLSTSCTATICSNQRTIVKIQASMAMGFEKKYDTMHARCDLQNLLITDELGICPFHEKIVSMKALDLAHAHAKDADTVGTTIIADVVRGKANVQIFSLPMEIYLNKLIIHALLTEFAVPKQNKARRIKRKMHAMKLDTQLGDGSSGSVLTSSSSSSSSTTAAAAKSLSQAVMKGQADISVTIKVHGPKIIIPEDSARDLGCLLLDCGYIELVSVLNSSGMTCDLKINAVNAGLPLTINDVYCLKGSSLYLIKPFDVALMAQNIDQSEADMTVSMSLSPGVNGELDRTKLARLLRITNGMTDVLSPKAALFGDESNASFGGDSKMISGVSRHTSGVELAGMTPGMEALSPSVSRKDGEDSNGSMKTGASLSMSTIAPFPVIPSPFADTKDPENVDMKIKVSIVSVSLDLMYDNAEYKEHIVFMIKGLELEMLNRPFDRQINFVLSDLSVQDSWRCESQRYVAWTPQSGDTNLITVSYLSVSTPESPLYTTHGSELRAEFSELCLAVDTATLLHLKPFMEVLLDKSNRTTVVQTLMTDTDQEDSSSANRYRLISMLPTVIDGPIGMKVDASLKLININLLRAPSVDVKHERGAPLEEAFSMDMMNMRVNVDMKELMNSTLRLGRVHILDNRKLSKDYVFKHLFCPSAMHPAASDATTEGTASGTAEKDAEGDLVTLFYNQESKQQTFITVAIAGISSYIAIDAMLDFSLIAMANFFAFTSLLSSPPPPPTSTLTSNTTVVAPSSSSRVSGAPKALEQALLRSESFSEEAFTAAAPSIDSPIADAPTIGAGAAAAAPSPLPTTASSSPTPPTPSSYYTMNAMVKMVNSKMIFLEDPAIRETRAIVAQCAVEVHFTREVKTYETTGRVEMSESVHCSIAENEMYVLRSIHTWHPIPILERFGVEVHVRRTVVNDVPQLMSAHVEVDDIDAKLSFNDLLLGLSILNRKSLAHRGTSGDESMAPGSGSSNSSSSPTKSSSNSTVTTASSSKASPPVKPATILVQFGLTSLHATLVNDFTTLPIPVLRLSAEDISFVADGTLQQLRGEGSTHMKVEYFNSPTLVWEPVVDSWKPGLLVDINDAVKQITLQAEHTLQLTVSGSMLETLLKSYSVFFHENHETVAASSAGSSSSLVPMAASAAASAASSLSASTASVSSEIVVQNVLGEGVEVHLQDSVSRAMVLHLADGATGVVSATADPMKKSWMKMFRLPNAVDLHIVGHGLEDRRPVLHLPFTVTKPKACMLLPSNGKPALPSGTSDGTANDSNNNDSNHNNKVFIVEAIEEEVYENARYDPIAGQWRTPFLLGDPYPFTDASGLVRKDMQSLQIQSDKWEWSGDWEVDMDGIPGRDFDDEGWEYASSFSFFTMVSARRTFQSMDGVRRRRWTRTRVPKVTGSGSGSSGSSSSGGNSGTAVTETKGRHIYRPFTIFWDVQTLKDGSRLVQVRSSFQIMNYLSCAIYVELHHSSWSRSHRIGPILEGETFCVPLLQSYASELRFKTSFTHSQWSPWYPCNIHSYDFKASKDIVCHHGVRSSYFRMWTVRDDKMLTVKLFPYVRILNRLLCDVQYNCMDRALASVEQGDIASGQEMQLIHANFKDELRLSIRFGAYQWSIPILVQSAKLTENGVIEMFKEASRGRTGDLLPIGYTSKVQDDYGLEITLFFKVAMIDRSALQLAVRTDYASASAKNNHHHALVRGFVNDAERSLVARWGSEGEEESSDEATGAGTGTGSSRRSSPREPLSRSSSAASKSSMTPSPLAASSKSAVRFPLIENVANVSPQNPLLVKMDLGTAAYTDSTYRWTHLPSVFRNKYSIRFANADRIYRSSQFFSFTTTTDTLIFVLVDASCVPKWITSSGFQPTTELAISRRIYQNRAWETNYRVYGQEVSGGHDVVLGGAWGNAEPNMYAVVLITTAEWKAEEVEEEAMLLDEANVTRGGGGGGGGWWGASASGSSSSAPGGGAAGSLASPYHRVFRQITHADQFQLDYAGLCWTEGCQGVTAFYSQDNYIRIRTGNEENWSEEINIDTRKNSSTKGSIEIHSERSSIIYHVSYALENLPGLYHRTELITFMPRFVVLNCLEESVFIAQRGSHRHLEFVPYTPEGWHQFDDKLGFDVKFRCHSTIWSLGSVNINEIGSTVLYIPYAAIEHGSGGSNSGSGSGGSGNSPSSLVQASMMHSRGMVLHVEVKLANHTDRCSIIVVLWQETIEAQSTMSVQNDTDLPITIRQADLELDHDLGSKEALYELVVPPHKHLPYGLCDPDCGQNVLVTVGTSLQHASKRVATLNILKVGHRLRLPYTLMQPGDNPTNATRGEVILNVTTSDVGHVLRITSPSSSGGSGRLGAANNTSSASITDLLLEDDASTMGDDPTASGVGTAAAEVAAASRALALPLFCFNIQLSSFGISLVLEKPRRREFLSLYVDGIAMKWQRRGHVNTLEFAVMDLQVDNYSESAIYPIILRSTKKEIHKSVLMDGEEEFYADTPAMDDLQRTTAASGKGAAKAAGKKPIETEEEVAEKEKPLIQLLLVRDVNVESHQAIFQRVVLRILPLAMEVDSATMQILFLDLLDDLKVLTSDQALALTMPQKWHRDFNRSLFYPGQQVIDMIAVKTAAQRHKMYIKKLTIHPMKMTISLYQTALPRRSKQETLQSALLNFLLQLAGVEKLQIRLSSFDVEDAMESTDTLLSLILTKSGQDLRSQLASIAGSLAVLGSPIGFARKVGSGVKAFFYEPYLGVVEGSNDFLSGLKKGTTRLISGVVTGTMDSAVAMMGSASKSISYLTGDEDYVRKRAIKRQQIRQGQKGIYAGFKEGGESFVSGIASGVSGMIAKPIEEAAKGGVKGFLKGLGLGVLGMAIKPLVGLTDGISSIAYGISTEVDPNNIFIHVRPPRALEPSPLDPTNWILVPLNLDAAFAQEFVMKRAIQHKYEDRFLTYVPLAHKDEAVILSEVYIFWRRKKNLWGRVWANISHCVPLGTGLGIMLYSGALQGKAELVVIPCGSTAILRRLYTAVAQNVHRMGNPAKVTPAALVDWTAQSQLIPHVHSTSSASASSSFSSATGGTSVTATMGLARSSGAVVDLDAAQQHQQWLQQQQQQLMLESEHYRRLLRDASLLSELDGHRFGSVNSKALSPPLNGMTEADVLTRVQQMIQRGSRSWKEVDELIWRMLWDWGCVHANLASCRIAATLLINRSDSPLQVTRVQMMMGRNVIIMGSKQTGYEAESRILWPRGYVVVVLIAFPQSPLEIGHLKAVIHSAAFTLMVASTQRESSCEAKGGFTTGFLEKTVSEWWSKYVVLVS